MGKFDEMKFLLVLYPHQGDQKNFDRRDCWNVRWAEDNPVEFALSEKTKLTILKGQAIWKSHLRLLFLFSATFHFVKAFFSGILKR